MARTFRLVTDCRFPIERMFEVSLDIDAQASSMRPIRGRAVAGVTSGPIALGQRVTWRVGWGIAGVTMTSLITDLERPHTFTDQQQRGPFRAYRHHHLFELTPTGTRMIDTVTVASPIAGDLAERLVLVPVLRRLIRRRNRTLLQWAAMRP